MKLTVSNANITNTLSTARMTLGNASIVESLTLGNVSVTPSQISIGSATITPTAVSVPTLVLGGSQFSGGLQGGIINYQEFTANGTWYNPYANASVNSALTGYEQVLVMAWGGGGGGSSNSGPSSTRAGGGGACALGYYTLSTLSNTVTVTVGLGGANSTTPSSALVAAANGQNTSFGTLIACGGGGGAQAANVGGGGGGSLGLHSAGTGGAPLGGAPGNPGGTSTFGGGGAGNVTGSNGGVSIFGGGGGASGSGGSGGNSIFGGGGGRVTSGTSAGQSLYNIGVGGSAFSSGGAFDGARGEVRVWVFGPAGTTAGAPTYSLTANTTTLYEGSSVLYTVSTTNIANGTALYYTLNNSSTAVATDFTTAVNGSVVINGGTGTFELTANNDADTTTENFYIDLRTGSTSGSIVANSSSINLMPVPYLNYYADTTDLTTYTFSGVDFGTAATGRLVVVSVHAENGGNGTEISSATIGGVAASIAIQSAEGPTNSGYVGIIYAVVPTGTSGTVSITFNIDKARCSIGVWSLYGMNSTPAHTANSGWLNTNTRSVTPVVGSGGYAILCCLNRQDSAGQSFTITNAEERYDTRLETQAYVAGADLISNSTVTFTCTASSQMELLSATWNP